MRILCIINDDYGVRHLANIIQYAPPHWIIEKWRAPVFFPLVIDYPEEFIPTDLAPADLILSFAQHKAIAELLPDIARLTGAKAVIAAIDNENSLPRGLARQLHGWLEKMNVACVTPKPLCSLTESEYWVTRRQHVKYDNPLIAEFAHYFGKPEFHIEVDPVEKKITSVMVKRDTVCGCARHVANKLIGVSVDDAGLEAGLAHHHFPCLASMANDIDFDDTLMHVSGNIMKESVEDEIRLYIHVQYIAPGFRSDDQ